MNNSKRDGEPQSSRRPSSSSLGDLIRSAFAGSPDAREAYKKLRTTYEKDEYRGVFPSSMFRVERRAVGAVRSRERVFFYSINEESICFVRNLWFVHQFLSRPAEVVRFLKTTKSEERRKMFEQRFEQLKALGSAYAKWLNQAAGISRKMGNFNPTKTELFAASEGSPDLGEVKSSSVTPTGSAAVADMIREVEQRASYQAGNPDDACEKALYFLALGRPDIGEIIAREVLAENPEHAVALYTNALFLLDASERHERQAFIHDTMHPHELEPVESEEFAHVERHAEESRQVWEKQSRAFLLMLKARRNWPKRFSVKCYELSPEMWQHRVEEWILRQAASRLAGDSRGLGLPNPNDAKAALGMLREVIADIWKVQGRSFFRSAWFGGLGRFIIVAAHVHEDVARDCLKGMEAALGRSIVIEPDLIWREFDMELPISQEPTWAETLIPALKNAHFCGALYAMRPPAEAANLLRLVAHTGLRDEYDRRTAMRSLMVRAVVLGFVRHGCLTQAIELCRDMVERRDWPATSTGEKLQSTWRYAEVYLYFEASRAAFEAKDPETAAKQAGRAIEQATGSLETIAGERPLVVFINRDEDAVTGDPGDFLCGQPNVVTDSNPSDIFPPAIPGLWVRVSHKPCWDDFVKWAETESVGCKSVLLAYGLWLAKEHGQKKLLLSRCNAFAAKLALRK